MLIHTKLHIYFSVMLWMFTQFILKGLCKTLLGEHLTVVEVSEGRLFQTYAITFHLKHKSSVISHH